MKRNLKVLLTTILVAGSMLSACAPAGPSTTAAGTQPGGTTTAGTTSAGTTAAATGKIAFVTGVGGLGDKSFNDLGHEGVLKLKAEGVTVDVAEPTAIAEMEGTIRNFAMTEEYALIAVMGGDSVDAVNAVSADFPDQKILIIDGFAGNDKVKSVILSQTDTSFLVGAYAGLMMKEGNLPNSQGKNTIGIVGGMDIPIIRSLIAGYEAGARFVNPDIKVLKTFVGAWDDPGKGAELATSLYNQGADILFQAAGGSGLGQLEAGNKLKLYGLGYDGNQNTLYPDSILASGIRGIADMVYSTAKDALAGKYVSGDLDITMKDDPKTSQLTMEGSNVKTPDSVLQKLEKIKQFLVEAKVAIPVEPDQVDAYIQQVGSFKE